MTETAPSGQEKEKTHGNSYTDRLAVFMMGTMRRLFEKRHPRENQAAIQARELVEKYRNLDPGVKHINQIFDRSEYFSLDDFNKLVVAVGIRIENGEAFKEILDQMLLAIKKRISQDFPNTPLNLATVTLKEALSFQRRAFFEDPVQTVLGRRAEYPNCLQLATVYSQVFKRLGVQCEYIQYAPKGIPHVGLYFPDTPEGDVVLFEEDTKKLKVSGENGKSDEFTLRRSKIKAIQDLKDLK